MSCEAGNTLRATHRDRVVSSHVKYGLVACVVLAGCFGSVAAPPAQTPAVVPAPKVLRSMALKPGQWARYRERDAHGDLLGQARFEVLATGLCGTWVQVQLAAGRQSRTWLLCVRDDGSAPRDQLTRALLDDDRDDAPRAVDPANPHGYASELASLVTRIVPPELAGAFEREDVTVPAGAFEQTLRISNGGSATWVHTLVPFAGVVKIDEADGREDVLEDFGDSSLELPNRFVEAASAARRRRPFTALGFGFGHQSESTPMSGVSTSLLGIVGVHVARTLDVLAQTSRLSNDGLAISLTGGGLRWSPLRRATCARIWFEPYLQAVVGYVTLDGQVYGRPRGVGAMASAGWLAGRGGDWGAAVQLDVLGATIDHRYDAVGAVQLGLVLQLELR